MCGRIAKAHCNHDGLDKGGPRKCRGNLRFDMGNFFSEDGSMTESGLKLVIDPGRGSHENRSSGCHLRVAEHGPLREAQKELGIKSR